MKPIQVHKRLYSVLPRGVGPVATSPTSTPGHVRPNSVSGSPLSSRSFYSGPQSPLSFFDSPPPPPVSSSARPNVGPTLRLIQAKPEDVDPHSSQGTTHSHNQSAQAHNAGSGPPLYSVALTSSPASQSFTSTNHLVQIFPYLPNSPPAHYTAAQTSESQHAEPHSSPDHVRYQLDIGAYGIPKSSKPNSSRWDSRQRNTHEHTTLAVQVGEDAYFITDNAMGVADGVGGWKNHSGVVYKSSETPSALFASRLMHFCSDEVTGHTSHVSASAPPSTDNDPDQLLEELEDSLSELEEGVDVLMILENAFDRAIKAHVVPDTTPESTPIDHPTKPLKAGSSTALLAILEHPGHRPAQPRGCGATPNQNRSSSASRASSHSERPEPSHVKPHPHDAVIKIANLGDSMAMLIRGSEVVWRSEEMWWSFNTPVQLGPVSPSKPKDAQIVQIPVQKDDILILASDGLSDNLWDEEILEEVVGMRDVLLKYTQTCATADANAGGGMQMLARRSLAGMLSEALCSKARTVAECMHKQADEVPFARRAREEGKKFKGGKIDDISVLVAVVSPVNPPSHSPS